jgi:hypothetical protein
MLNRLVSTALVGLAIGTLYSLNKQWQDKRKLSTDAPAAKHPREQVWEGEGGALPVTGAQLGPDPAVTQTSTEKADEAQGVVH